MTPLPVPIEVITPLGPALCIGIIDDIENIEWVTFIKATGEPWFWRNPDIRLLPDVTSGRPDVSPFGTPNPKLARQIARYKKAGWL